MNLGVPLLNLNGNKQASTPAKKTQYSEPLQAVQLYNAGKQFLDYLNAQPPKATPQQPTASAAPAVDYAAQARAQQAREEAARVARIQSLRGGVLGKHQAALDAYNALFGDIDNLARERSGEIERKAGDDINELTSQYTGSIPGIENSYAAVGAANSTDTSDAKDKAKSGFDKSVKTVGENKQADLAKVGSYVSEQKAKWNADRDSINRLMGRVNETEDEGDLRSSRNEVEDKIGSLGAERATLNTDSGARGQLSQLTGDNGRFDAIKGSLDNIMQSSMAGGVKQAAVQAVMDSSDLNDEEKNKVKQLYGNVYDAPNQV